MSVPCNRPTTTGPCQRPVAAAGKDCGVNHATLSAAAPVASIQIPGGPPVPATCSMSSLADAKHGANWDEAAPETANERYAVIDNGPSGFSIVDTEHNAVLYEGTTEEHAHRKADVLAKNDNGTLTQADVDRLNGLLS